MNMCSGNLYSGELVDEFFECKHITWKISNVLPLPNIVDYRVQSPAFSFAGAAWKLELYPCGQTEYDTNGYIDFMIKRLESQFLNHHLLYKVYLKTRNGKEFKSYSSNCCFDSRDSDHGVVNYLKASIFMNKRNVLAPNGVLTVVWEIKTRDTTLMNSFSQIESIAPSLESSAENSKKEPKSSATTFKESSAENSKEEPKSSATAFKELAEEQFKEESLPSTSGSIESQEETSKEEQEPKASTCKGCDCRTQHITAYPSNKMLRDFKELFLNQEHWDVVIKVKGKEFHAHKAILTARSSVLASTFRNDMKEKASGMLDIEDLDPSSFADFLCFLYCGNAESITVENVFSLFTAADKYDVEDLRLECVEFMKRNLSVDTFCDTIVLAVQHSERELIELTTDFFKKNLPDIIVTVKWQSLLIENPIVSNELLIKALASNKT